MKHSAAWAATKGLGGRARRESPSKPTTQTPAKAAGIERDRLH